ncbi:hypothetical protein ACTPEF_23305, partial [Clostridioides difficile]
MSSLQSEILARKKQLVLGLTAFFFYIKSHHCVQKSMLSVLDAVQVAKEYNLPLIVDAAAEEDLNVY